MHVYAEHGLAELFALLTDQTLALVDSYCTSEEQASATNRQAHRANIILLKGAVTLKDGAVPIAPAVARRSSRTSEPDELRQKREEAVTELNACVDYGTNTISILSVLFVIKFNSMNVVDFCS